MSVTVRFTAAIGAVTILLGLLFAGPATAEPYSPAASISVSESSPCHGASLTVSGTGYLPGETVVLTIGAAALGQATVGADGSFSVAVTVPAALRGSQTITATGRTDGQLATTLISVTSCSNGTTVPSVAPTVEAVSVNGNGSGSGGSTGNGNGAVDGNRNGGTDASGLSDTGVAVLGLLVIAVLSMVVGSVLLLGGRRRRSSAARPT